MKGPECIPALGALFFCVYLYQIGQKMRLLELKEEVSSLLKKVRCLWSLMVSSLPVVPEGSTPRPFVVFEGELYFWDSVAKQYKTVSSSGVPAHTHVGANITDLATYLATTLASSETYADGLFETIVGTPTPAVAFDTIQEIATYLENNQTDMAGILTALGNRVRVDINNQGLSSTEKLNARTNIDLDQVNNTSDLNKPVSTATAAAIVAAAGNPNFRNKKSGTFDAVNGFVGIGCNFTTLANSTLTNATVSFAGAFALRYLWAAYTASSGANAVAGIRYSTFGYFSGPSYLGGGFDCSFTFFLKVYATSSYRFSVAIRGANAVPTNVDPSTLLNNVQFAMDSGDSTIQLMHNDGLGTCTKVNTGMARPTVDNDNVFVAKFYNDGITGNIVATLIDLKTNTVFTHTITSDLPAGNLPAYMNLYSSNGPVTAQAGIGIISIDLLVP